MKKFKLSILIAAIVMGATSRASCQQFGIIGGLNISHMSGLSYPGSKDGIALGGFVDLHVIDGLSFEPELLFSQEGGTAAHYLPPNLPEAGAWYPDTWTLDYIEIPLLVKRDVISVPMHSMHLELYAGPDFAFMTSSEVKQDGTISRPVSINESANTKLFDFRFMMGGGPTMKLGSYRVGIDLRYTFGTDTIFKNDLAMFGGDARNRVWSILARVGI